MGRLAALLVLALPAVAAEEAGWRYVGRADGLPHDDVFDLCPAGADALWAATGDGVVLVLRHEFRRIHGGVPRRLAPAPGGGAYALYAEELRRIARDGAVEHLPLPFDPARATVRSLVSLDGRPALLADGRVLIFDGSSWEAPGLDGVDGEPHRLGVRDQGLVVETDRGLWRRVPGAGWRADPGAFLSRGPWEAPGPGGEPCVRHAGRLWRPTRGRGIGMLPAARFTSVPLDGLGHVHALARAPDGAIWCGTKHGIARVAGSSAEVLASIDGRELGVVTACAVDREGRVWIGSGSSFPGVFRREADGTWTHLGAEAGFLDAFVHRITVDAAGTLWFAVLGGEGETPQDGHGAWVFAGGSFRKAEATDELPSGRVYDVVVRDRAGVLWFATLKGLAAYQGDRVVHYGPEQGLAGEKVWCLCAARDGSLWIGYQEERGASRLARGAVRHFDVDDGLCDGNVWSIVEGEPGVLWFATANGLTRYDGRRWSCFRTPQGLPADSVWPLLPEPDGSLWIGTLGGGLAHFHPDDRDPPRTRFAESRVAVPAGESVRVTWQGTDAWFETPPGDLWYRWRLDDGRWSGAAPAAEVELLPREGEHVLEVQAIDRLGNAEDPPARLRIAWRRARPPAWAWAAAAAAAAGAVALLAARRR